MPEDRVDALILDLDAHGAVWPIPREAHARRAVLQARALRRGDAEWLRTMAGWDADRSYVVDPLPKRIAAGYADFLFADPPRLLDEQNQDVLDAIADGNRLDSRLYRAERTVVSEGEAWWKLHVNLATAQVPLITWCSRLDVVPMFDGDRVLAVAFVTERTTRWEKYRPEDEEEQEVVYRHAEVHGPGRVANVLYRGVRDELGRRVPLESVPQTAGYAETWEHGLPILAGRVVNDLDDDPALGVSEYDGVRDLLLALNEAVTISVENARLTGKDRIFVAGKFRQQDGGFDASLEVFEVDGPEDSTLGEGSSPSIYGVEKKYDAAALWLHIEKLVRTAVSRTGLVPQWIGEEVDGQAESGTAIRLRFLPTTNASKGKLAEWRADLPVILRRMLDVAALPTGQGGLGLSVTGDELPAVEFGEPLPVDEQEQTDTDATAVTAGIQSRRLTVRERHPDWTDEQVAEELAFIAADQSFDPPQLPPPADT